MSDHFSLDDYESEHDDVDEYLAREDTPFDHKMSAADGAIEHRQQAKGEKKGQTSTAPKSDVSHQSKLVDPEERSSVSARVNNRREGEASTQVEEPEKVPDDPAEW